MLDLLNPNATSGAADGGTIAALQKALDSGGYGTDMASLTGGAALRMQSLDATMQTTIQANKHFKLFNMLPKPKAGATVDEWTEQDSIGGFLGGSTNTESGAVADATGNYTRKVGLVKFLMTRRQVTLVATLNDNLVSPQATEQQNGAKQLLSDAEYLSFEGDASVVPTEFSGIYAQMKDAVTAGEIGNEHVLDARGGAFSTVDLVMQAAATAADFGNFGVITDMFMPNKVQADFDSGLAPAFRVPLPGVGNGGLELGAPVRGIRTSWGDIANQPDVFCRDETRMKPFDTMYPAVAAAQVAIKPQTVTVALASDATAMFTSAQAGNYYYAVAGVNAAGQSAITKSTVAAVAAGQKATITIAGSAGDAETGYVLYRTNLGATNATANFREFARIPKTAGGTTVTIDRNWDIPGTCKAYLLNMSSGDTAITWRQLLPMMKFDLYPTANVVIPWAQLLFGYLRISKRKQHVVIKNIVPSTAQWKPFQ